MDYKDGFSDAVEMFEEVINRVLKDEEVSEGQALDSIIATLYVAKLQEEMLDDEYVNNLERQHEEHMNLFSSYGIGDIFYPMTNREEF